MKLSSSKTGLIVGSICMFLIVASCSKFKNASINETYLDTTEPDYSGLQSTLPEFNSQIHLGRILFYDKSLSRNNSISCASCHKQEVAFADNVALSRGFENKLTHRNSIAIQNLNQFSFGGFQNPTTLFWDGRETDLNSLMSKPIANHIEMGMDDPIELMKKLNSLPYYKGLVQKAFKQDELTMDLMKSSMVAFVSQISAAGSKFDQVKAKGIGSFNALEMRGEQLFNSTYQCINCHQPNPGGYFNNDFANIGLDVNNIDKGRNNVSNSSADIGRFKIPDLHNVALTAPYMHDGRFNTLEEVLEHYSRNIKDNPNTDFRLKNSDGTPINLNITSEDKKAIIAFLNTMTDYEMIKNPNLSNPFKSK